MGGGAGPPCALLLASCFGQPGGGLPRDGSGTDGSSGFSRSTQVSTESLRRGADATGPAGSASPGAVVSGEQDPGSRSEADTPDDLAREPAPDAENGPDDDSGEPSGASGDRAEADGLGEEPGGAASPESESGDVAGDPGEGAQDDPPVDAVPSEPEEPPVAPAGNLPAASPRAEPLSCPPAASYCSGFELGNLLDGASFVSQSGAFVPAVSLLVDEEVRFSGAASMQVPAAGGQGFDYRMLSVAVPGPDFWVRLHLRTDVAFGDEDGDSPLLASVLTEGFNGDRALQLSEQFGRVLLNKDGQLHGTSAPNPVPTDPGVQLGADTWYCVEVFFGGTSGDVLAFVGGVPIIEARAWLADDYQSFRFGYLRFNTDRTWWFDDVAVAPNRIGCQ